MIFAPVIRTSAHLNGLRAMDRSLERFLAQALRNPAPQAPAPASAQETEHGYQLQFDVPGLSRDQLQVDIEDRVLRIASAAEAPRRYRWAFELPEALEASTSSAQLNNGVLTLKLSKKAPAQTQGTRIQID